MFDGAVGAALARLLDIGGPALGPPDPRIGLPPGVPVGLGNDLAALLAARNGFVAFVGALQIFPAGASSPTGLHDLARWNAADTWRDAYGALADGLYFFAEDAFGGQFALSAEGVVAFDAETGATEPMGATLDAWAQALLADWDYRTGSSLAEEWQRLNGALRGAERLIPRRPFIAGGGYATDNLLACERVLAMRCRGDIATRIAALPDGARFDFRGYPPPDAARRPVHN